MRNNIFILCNIIISDFLEIASQAGHGELRCGIQQRNAFKTWSIRHQDKYPIHLPFSPSPNLSPFSDQQRAQTTKANQTQKKLQTYIYKELVNYLRWWELLAAIRLVWRKGHGAQKKTRFWSLTFREMAMPIGELFPNKLVYIYNICFLIYSSPKN